MRIQQAYKTRLDIIQSSKPTAPQVEVYKIVAYEQNNDDWEFENEDNKFEEIEIINDQNSDARSEDDAVPIEIEIINNTETKQIRKSARQIKGNSALEQNATTENTELVNNKKSLTKNDSKNEDNTESDESTVISKINKSLESPVKKNSSIVKDTEDAVSFLLENDHLFPDSVTKDKENRPHNCKVCNKSFMRKSNLVDHLRLHANLRLYKCDHCDKSFVQAGNYRSHLRIHTKERPYKCSMCPKTYNQSSALKVSMTINIHNSKF